MAAIPFAIAGHLVAEAVALDRAGFGAVVLAQRHVYFIALGIASLATLLFIDRSLRGPQRRTQVAQLIRALPFGGKGAGFAGLTFAVQIGFFGVTQAVEHCPIEGGDLIGGLLTAVCAAIIGAVVLSLFESRLLAFALLFTWVSGKRGGVLRGCAQPVRFVRFAERRGAFLFSIASRPPPAWAVFPTR